MWKTSIQMREYETVFIWLDFAMFLGIKRFFSPFALEASLHWEENLSFSVYEFLN